MATQHFLDKCKELQQDPYEFLRRHLACDWSEMTTEDRDSNEAAITYEDRIFSGYDLKDGTRMFVITEWDRSYTTLMLADEY
jgi:hypothetical protein